MKIVVAGGHLTPAYGFIEHALSHQDKLWVIGTQGDHSLEALEFARLKVPYYSIFPVKYDRYHKFLSLLKLPTIIVPIIQSLFLLYHLKPDRVVVFGSFSAVPVALAAKILKLPCYLHEQTRVMGLANRLICRFATGCALSYPDSANLCHHSNTRIIGNILRQHIWHPPHKPSFVLPSSKPILYITGGNQGSVAILTAIKPLIPTLTKNYQLIIQYGKSTFSPNNPVIVAQPWFNDSDVAWILSHAHLVISRGGANTVAELMVAKVPAIIIPLPQTSHDEQFKNASMLADRHAAILLPQSQLSPDSLQQAINRIESDYSYFHQAAKQLTSIHHPQAASQLYDFVTQNL